MATRNGVKIIAPIVTPTDLDTFPTAYNTDIYGGWHCLTTLTQRNAIFPDRRAVGMVCSVSDEGKSYQLVGGVDNSNWAELKIYYPFNVEEFFTPTIEGQVLFVLNFNIYDLNFVTVNGLVQHKDIDYTININEIEWISTVYTLSTTDTILVNYKA